MVIFVTDEGRYWNHKNPILEKYADCVVVVCLNGEEVTDKYKCVVSPYKHVGLGMTDYSVLSNKFEALKSVWPELRLNYGYHDDLVFLTDSEPQSLYPYLVLKDKEIHNRMHLWCMEPWEFEGKHRTQAFAELIQDIDKLMSIHYIGVCDCLELLDSNASMSEMVSSCGEWLNEMLPSALYEINEKLQWGKRYYYDLKVRRYISTDNSYSKVLKEKPLEKENIDNFIPVATYELMGRTYESFYLSSINDKKAAVEQLHPRLDGKEVCETLKQMRKRLAEENNIQIEMVDCPSTGPCAGTCQQCDNEIRYLQEQLMKKREVERIYSYTEIKAKHKGRIIQSEENVKIDILMGVPAIFERDINASTELTISDFRASDVEKMGGEENE